MAQESGAQMTAPRAWLLYAWADVALHPTFLTFQRWFPLMKARWRAISLAVSFVLIVLNTWIWTALTELDISRGAQSLHLSQILASIAPSRGLFRLFYGIVGSVLALYAMPAAVALISSPGLGPYAIRFKRVSRPWIQSQPAICAHLLVAELDVWAFAVLSRQASSQGFISTLLACAVVFFAIWLPMRSWMLSYGALSAGSGRTKFQAGLAAAVPGLFIWLLPSLLGFPCCSLV